MLGRIQRATRKGVFNSDSHYIQRWPTTPKIAMFAPPNAFGDEISKRLAIDLGLPIVSMT